MRRDCFWASGFSYSRSLSVLDIRYETCAGHPEHLARFFLLCTYSQKHPSFFLMSPGTGNSTINLEKKIIEFVCRSTGLWCWKVACSVLGSDIGAWLEKKWQVQKLCSHIDRIGKKWVGVKILEQLNVERPIFRTFEISNIKRTKDKLFDFIIFDFEKKFIFV